MEPKKGDRVSLDAKKVGQPRRAGEVTEVVRGISATRYYVRWDDGTTSLISPGAGILLVESGKAKAKLKPKASKPKAKAKKKK